MRKFQPSEKSTFSYWFAHWKAFQTTAFSLGCWRLRFLFHDIEKPWLMLIWRDYPRVKKWHRAHNSHHLLEGRTKYDWLGMMVDWECSRFTKIAVPLNAFETYELECQKHPEYAELLTENLLPLLKKYGIAYRIRKDFNNLKIVSK